MKFMNKLGPLNSYPLNSYSLSSYSQGQTNKNLLRLLLSLEQAKIEHLLLEPIFNRISQQSSQEPTQGAIADPTIEILFTEQGLAKFHQVFVGQRFVQMDGDDDRSFWDSRTGLTLHISLPDEVQPPPDLTAAIATFQTTEHPINRIQSHSEESYSFRATVKSAFVKSTLPKRRYELCAIA
jgi:hypothetical protein